MEAKSTPKNRMRRVYTFSGSDPLLVVSGSLALMVSKFHNGIRDPKGQEHKIYSKTYVKRPLKNRQNKDLNDKW